jgi:hypothetical protein
VAKYRDSRRFKITLRCFKKEWPKLRFYECKTDVTGLKFQRAYILQSNISLLFSQPILNMVEEVPYDYGSPTIVHLWVFVFLRHFKNRKFFKFLPITIKKVLLF